jgi:alanyl-tRNA synthetase
MNSQDLRKRFLEYFESKGHQVIPSASLVPENDPTVLFTTAGMQPLVPFLLGEKHPAGNQLCNLQKCIRTGDIDEVGDSTHLTFFEMMGYWSLGAYWKKEAIQHIFGFVTEVLGLKISELAVTCFEGDPSKNIAKDEEAAQIWRSLGIPEERIAFLGYEDNWWGPAGETGPCGPDSEIFVWVGGGSAPQTFDPADKGWMEIGNDVFMQYEKVKVGDEYAIKELAQKNVDFGAGFERISAYIEGRSNVYETELFSPIIEEIELISGKKYSDFQQEFRIIADHLKAATFIIGDGVVPSNKDRGYVLRRLIRRAIVKAHQLGVGENFTTKIARKVFEIYKGIYFDQVAGETGSFAFAQDDTENNILAELEKEETKFRRTLKEGLKVLNSYSNITAKNLFDLYQSFGLPLEISIEELQNQGKAIDNSTIEQFNDLIFQHQELSRTASAGMFKGGLADGGEQTKRLHTAAHLMLAALRQILGDHVYQKGSNITPERLRFDFSHPEKLTGEQLIAVENWVNEVIAKDLPVNMEEMSLEDAKACGAMGVFESKYGEVVKVYKIGQIAQGGGLLSQEICGGPHVGHTGELGHFKIVKEEASSAGVRRIKAILE